MRHMECFLWIKCFSIRKWTPFKYDNQLHHFTIQNTGAATFANISKGISVEFYRQWKNSLFQTYVVFQSDVGAVSFGVSKIVTNWNVENVHIFKLLFIDAHFFNLQK